MTCFGPCEWTGCVRNGIGSPEGVHVLIPDAETVSPSAAEGTVQCDSAEDEMGEVILGYPGGPGLMARALVRGRQEVQKEQ